MPCNKNKKIKKFSNMDFSQFHSATVSTPALKVQSRESWVLGLCSQWLRLLYSNKPGVLRLSTSKLDPLTFWCGGGQTSNIAHPQPLAPTVSSLWNQQTKSSIQTSHTPRAGEKFGRSRSQVHFRSSYKWLISCAPTMHSGSSQFNIHSLLSPFITACSTVFRSRGNFISLIDFFHFVEAALQCPHTPDCSALVLLSPTSTPVQHYAWCSLSGVWEVCRHCLFSRSWNTEEQEHAQSGSQTQHSGHVWQGSI